VLLLLPSAPHLWLDRALPIPTSFNSVAPTPVCLTRYFMCYVMFKPQICSQPD
jgi:hypothetical protein